MQKRIIVTGSARIGTLYLSHILARIGVKATHERVYNYAMDPDGSDHAAISEAWKGKEVDVNWMAAPFLRHEPVGTIIWHQLRDPLKVVRCFYSHKMLDDPRAFAMDLVHKVQPECWERPDDLAKAVWHVHHWNGLVEAERERLPILTYRVEDMNPSKLRWLLQASGIDESLLRGESIEDAFAATPTNTNGCGGHKPVEWSDVIKCQCGPELRSKARSWGYRAC